MRVLWLCLALVVLPTLTGTAAGAIGERYVAGVDYTILPTPVSTHDPKRIEVVEVFSYVCPHCFHFDPTIAAWRAKQPADVDFQRLPAVWNPLWRMFGQGYYAAQSMNVAETAHAGIFKALHVEQKRIESSADLAKLYAASGVAAGDFLKTMDSFGVRASVQQADVRTRAYAVTGVPAMVVAGRYRVTGEIPGGNDAMLPIVDFLVQKERDARASARPASGAPKSASTKPAAAKPSKLSRSTSKSLGARTTTHANKTEVAQAR